MIYRGHRITANAPDYQYFEVNDDGTIGAFIDNGGNSGAYEFDIEECTYVADDPADSDWETVDGGYDTFEQAKAAIDQRIKDATTFQSEAGN